MGSGAIPATPIESDLRWMGHGLLVPEPADTIVDTVMTMLELEPAPLPPSHWRWFLDGIAAVGTWLRNRWRLATAVVVGGALALILASPAGAGVREWLGFGSVVIQQQEQPAAGSPEVTGMSTGDAGQGGFEMPLEQARAAVDFEIGIPAVLGAPDQIVVSDDALMVSMRWSEPTQGSEAMQGSTGNDGPIRLDQIAGSLAPYYVKKYYEDIEYATVNSTEAIWLAEPHPIAVLNSDGSERVATARQSGPSLIWQEPGVTLRLEGVSDLAQARIIAESLQD